MAAIVGAEHMATKGAQAEHSLLDVKIATFNVNDVNRLANLLPSAPGAKLERSRKLRPTKCINLR
jgi:hypothetical protein